MSNVSTLNLQQATRAFCSTETWRRPVEVTLTMKQALTQPYRRLTPAVATQNFRHFMNVLNTAAFGNAFKRYGKRLKVIAVQEGTKTKRLHYHAIIDCPVHIEPMAFDREIRQAWSKTEWSHDHTYVVPSSNAISNGFLSYITKLKDKLNFADSIDWTNAHIG